MTLAAEEIGPLYRREARRMTGFFVRRTHDPEVALDLVAETFACAIRDRRQFRGGDADAATAWLYGIARNQLNGWYRRGVVERRACERLGIERPELSLEEHERLIELGGSEHVRARIRRELGGLPHDQRRAVELRVVDERSYEETAATLGISPQTARARVSRGLRALAAVLGDAPTEVTRQ
jgi:RNA polymerase sigma-70 factor (ECF subfamily)